MKKIILLFSAICISIVALSQNRKTENVIIVTLDGMRWQEVFTGVDKAIMEDTLFNRNINGIRQQYWAETAEERRKKLFPFLWTVIEKQGQIYGNRAYKNYMNNANPHWFSYPGYNELFTGYPDASVNSNDKIYNKHENVLGFINKQKGYKNKVAAFTTWDVFPYILNAPASGIYVNADVDTFKFTTPQFQLINDLQFLSPQPVGVRPDVITYIAAKEYVKMFKPKALYIAFDETDDFAHVGLYDQYIGSAFSQDAMIRDLWNTLQSMPQYKNKTTLIITCDHGRGDKVKANWRHHGKDIEDAGQLWMAVMGPDTTPEGEIKTAGQLYQEQVAATIAQLLGFTFTANHPVAKPITSVYTKAHDKTASNTNK